MITEKTLWRHAISEANNRDNFGTPLFGNDDAELMPLGWQQAAEAGELQRSQGIAVSQMPIAVSSMLRSEQTALGMGYSYENVSRYEILREVDHELEHLRLKEVLDARMYPVEALRHADRLLDELPKEPVYITHGLLASAALYLAGMPEQELFIQKFATPRKLIYDPAKRRRLRVVIEERGVFL